MSKIIESLRGDMAALYEAGIIDQQTKAEFDAACVASEPEFSACDIRTLRESLQLSLSAFALHLRTTEAHLQDWELGLSAPPDSVLKLLESLAKKRV